ncbi:MAG: HlyD family efflux transporter periplasmic adaptor subunit [Patescibacteria group bacterium]
MRILSKRNVIIGAILIVIFVLGAWKLSRPAPTQITTAKVERGKLVQSIEPSGTIKTKSEINLNFDATGRIATINIKVGDIVKAGQMLAKLDTKNLDSSVMQASADLAKAKGNLAAYEAGSTPETIAQYEADVQKAEANLLKAQVDLANLKAGLAQTYKNAYENQITILQGALAPMETAMTDIDSVLGVESTSANDTFDKAITSLDNSSFYYSQAKVDFQIARTKINDSKTATNALNAQSNYADIENAGTKIKSALDAVATSLNSSWTVLDKLDTLNSSHNLSAATVTAKKTTLDTNKAAVTTKKTATLAGEQSIASAKLNYGQESGASGSSQVAQYEASVKIYEAALAGAQATLAIKKAPPREVDLQSYKAAVSSAQAALFAANANRGKAIIYAPVDGVITKKNNEVGETTSAATPVLIMIDNTDWQNEVEVNISEADISKIRNIIASNSGKPQSAKVVLDALGPEQSFYAEIVEIDPAQTVISDVVYYRAKLKILGKYKNDGTVNMVLTKENLQAIKPGMTASVTIYTDERDNVLMIPERAVIVKDGKKIARVLTDKKTNKIEEKEVVTGLRGNEGMIEIISGLNEGEEVVTFIKN